MIDQVGLEISKDCSRHLDDCEISARFNGLKSWRLPTHLRNSTLQTTIFFRDNCIPVFFTQSFKVGN